MKTRLLVAAATLACAASAFAADKPHDHAHDHQPAHGGVVVEANHVDFELVAKPGVIRLYMRELGKPADLSKASAKLTLLTGREKQEIELKPAGDRLEAAGSFKVEPGSKAVAVVNLPGKPASTVRFAVK